MHHSDQPAVPFSRINDDSFHRVRTHAENRARRNQHPDPARAGREAMELHRATLALRLEPNVEAIVSQVAGEYRR